jgi:hypothetical protein
VNRATGLAVAVTLAVAAACPRHAAAQLYRPLPQRYLLTTDVFDGRAVWVNPAGLARRFEASIGADATVEHRAGSTRLSQYGVTVRSRNLAVGWLHDRYPGASGANNFAFGVGLGDEGLSLGATRLWYGGPRGDKAWDIAARGRLTRTFDVSVVWRNAGSPAVRDTSYGASIIPAVALHLLEGRIVAGAEWDLATDLHALQEVRVGATCIVGTGVAISLRSEFSPGASRRGFAVGVTLGVSNTRSTLAALLPAGFNSVETVGVSTAVVAAEPLAVRH